MKLSKILSIAIFLCLTYAVDSQDLHQSVYDLAPVVLNPAHTGDHNQVFRAGLAYRSQWNSVSSSGYKTSQAYIDAPMKSIGKNAWLGLGISIYNDKAGIVELSNSSLMGSAAVHLNTNEYSVLSLGFQGGFVNRSFNTESLLFEEQIEIGGTNRPFTPDLNNGKFSDNPVKMYTDLGTGIKYHSKLSNGAIFNLGVAARHIASSNNFLEGSQTPVLLTAHSRVSLPINRRISIQTGAIIYKSSGASQLNLQTLFSIKKGIPSKRSKSIQNPKATINFGLGYRVKDNDALLCIAQVAFSSYKLSFAYDINMSELSSATNRNGGFELGFTYTAPKSKSFETKVGCPGSF